MLRMGMMIRSAKMKLITPPKLMPPFHSTTASGMLPTEHTKLSSEMIGRIPIISRPPANSAATNCQPSRTSKTMPSSKTRLVLANSKRMALARVAPLRNNPREIATAAYEQLELAAPKSVAKVTPRRSSLPSVRMIACLETTVCTIAEITKPSVSGHRTSQNMKKAIWSASQISLSTNTFAMPSQDGGYNWLAADADDAVSVRHVVRDHPRLESGVGDG